MIHNFFQYNKHNFCYNKQNFLTGIPDIVNKYLILNTFDFGLLA